MNEPYKLKNAIGEEVGWVYMTAGGEFVRWKGFLLSSRLDHKGIVSDPVTLIPQGSVDDDGVYHPLKGF